MFWVLGLVAIVFGAAYWKLTDAPPTESGISPLPLPQSASSVFENTRPEAAYVGSQACAECHAAQHASYLQTHHSRSMSRVAPEQEPPGGTVDHPLSHRRFEVERLGEHIRHREILVSGDHEEFVLADHAVEYGIGSGRVARTYATVLDGFLVESPVTWYSSRQAWGMSPGYDTRLHRSFQRVVNFGCMTCHSGRVERAAPDDERLTILEAAIGCERCHGPGSLHVEFRMAGGVPPREIDRTVVNPRHLSRELQEAVCAQCHLMGDASVVVRGKSPGDFRPGLPLENFRLEYRLTDAGSEMTVVGHVDQLRRSRCYRESETLTCTTCHDPHDPVDEAKHVAHYRRICQTCHTSDACGVSEAQRMATRQNDCMSCHMPQSPTEVRHVAFTHHRIGVHAEGETKRTDSQQSVLVPMQDVSKLPEPDRERGLGLAYSELFLANPGDPSLARYWPMAELHLLRAYEGGAGDPAVLVALANIAFSAGEQAQAEALCKFAEELHPTGKVKLNLLSGRAWIRFRQQQWSEAGELFKMLVARRRDAVDWYMLGVCLEKQGKLREALAAYEKSGTVDPSSAEAHRKLAELHQGLGNVEKSAHHRRLEQALQSLVGP